MTNEPRTITIDPDSELGRALDDSDGAPVVLVRNRTRFLVIRDPDDPWAGYDPEKVRAGLRKIAGTLTPEEGERVKEMIYRGREEGTRPLDRPRVSPSPGFDGRVPSGRRGRGVRAHAAMHRDHPDSV